MVIIYFGTTEAVGKKILDEENEEKGTGQGS